DAQTELTEGYQWKLALNGKAIPADRVLELENTVVSTPNGNQLFKTAYHQVKSGDRIAIMGANGCGKSTLLRLLWQCYQQDL
ncbi:ATP-binding cassette domain-containing protein, partial [Escherichia coli]|nr:ATP-binding cassette domain-containing protein [Escherichia coli]